MSRTVTIDGEDYELPTGSSRNWLAEYNRLLLALVDAVNAGAEQPQGVAILSFGSSSIPADSSSPRYLHPWGEESAAESVERHIIIPQSGTLSRVYFRADGNADHDAECAVFLTKSGGASIELLLPALQQNASNLDDTLAVSAGDRIYAGVQMAEGVTVQVTRPILSCVFTPS